MSAPARRPLYSEEDLAEARAWLHAELRAAIRTDISHVTVSEWAESKRVIPEGLSAMPGPFSFAVTPYLREIADSLSATDPTQEIAVMKGAQVGFTVGVLENWLGYIIDVEPGPTMFVSGDKEVAEASIELRVDRMIQSAGIAEKIFSQSEKAANKKTGDTKKKKEFPGGFLIAAGPNSAAKLRTFSVRYEPLDEIDAYPTSTEGEGDPLTLLKRRTDSFEAIRKILYGSTPLAAQTSKIEPLFKAGDQRRYHVPCKKCHTLQPLEWRNLRYDRDEAGALVYSSIRYVCPHCQAEWKNEDKAYFLKEEGHGGEAKWVPTAKAARPGLRSYHISSLYSPVGMRSWESIVEEWVGIGDSVEKLRAFTNTVLGETFVEKGAAPPWERIYARREPYLAEARLDGRVVAPTWPEGALLLTLGADVQKNRIEAELVAWGDGRESWSLGYFVLAGNTEDENDPVWDSLQAIMESNHAGHPLSMALIDSGFAKDAVYRFCERFEARVFAVKGDPRVGIMRRAFAVKEVPGYSCQRVDLDVDLMKQAVYADIDKQPSKDAGAPLPAGYAHFPEEYDPRYFQMLTAEERIKTTNKLGQERYVWSKPEGRRNEALDCRVYALGALYVLASAACNAEDGSVDWAEFWRVVLELSH